MKLMGIVPKMGDPSNYIGKPFNNEFGKTIGSVTNCIDIGNYFELTIDTQLELSIKQSTIPFEMGCEYAKPNNKKG